jgi:hypothetical protein
MKHLRPHDEENMENTDPDDDDLMWQLGQYDYFIRRKTPGFS